MDFGSPCSPRDSQKSSPTPQFKSINSLALRFLYDPTLTCIHDCGKNHSFDQMDLCGKVMSLLFNMLPRLVIAFLSRSKHLLISWLQSLSTMILELKRIKSVTVCTFSPSVCQEVMGDQMPWSYYFKCWVLSQLFHCPLSLLSRGSLVPLHFLP